MSCDPSCYYDCLHLIIDLFHILYLQPAGGSDYTTVVEQIVLMSDSTCFYATIIDDDALEMNETFDLFLFPAMGFSSLVDGFDMHTITIIDDSPDRGMNSSVHYSEDLLILIVLSVIFCHTPFHTGHT